MVTSLKVVVLAAGPLPFTPTCMISTPEAPLPSVTVLDSPGAGMRQTAVGSRRSSSLVWHTEMTRLGDGSPVIVTDAVVTPAGSRIRTPLSDSSELARWRSVIRRLRLVPATVVPPPLVATGTVVAPVPAAVVVAGAAGSSLLPPPPPHPAAAAARTRTIITNRNRRTGAG